MADSLKLSDMQRTNIEFERQRHLANWLMKSGPHMATSNPQKTVELNVGLQATSNVVSTTIQATTPTSPLGQGNTTVVNAISGGNLNGTNIHQSFLATGNFGSHPHLHVHGHGHGSHVYTYANGKQNGVSSGLAGSFVGNPVYYLMTSNGSTTGAAGVGLGVGSGGCIGGQQHHGIVNTSNVTSTSKHAGPLAPPTAATAAAHRLPHLTEGRKAKLRRFNSHDTSSNMFSVADFENARLARRNEVELKQRLQRRMRNSYTDGRSGFTSSSKCGLGILTNGLNIGDLSNGENRFFKHNNDNCIEPLPVEEFLERYSLPRVVRISYKTQFCQMNETLQSSSSNDSSTVTSNSSTNGAIILRNSAETNTNNSSLSTSTSSTSTSAIATSAGSLNSSQLLSTVVNMAKTSSSIVSTNNHMQCNAHTHTTANHTTNATSQTNGNVKSSHNKLSRAYSAQNNEHQEEGELFVLYRLVRHRHIYHGHNAKTTVTNRKKGVLIPQEFPGYFSLLNDKGLPTATQYTSIIQLVRERVCKFVSVENMSAFSESQTSSQVNGSPNSPVEGCLSIYGTLNANSGASNRPQYVKTTARGGQVFKLLAVYEDGKQDQSALSVAISCGGLGSSKQVSGHGREKEKSRYAQLLNEQRQTLYVSLSTKGKFYEIEPGIPQILQKRLDMCNDGHKKINPDCVHRITTLITPNKQLPVTLRYISGPSGCVNAIPEIICIDRISTENVVVACPIEDAEMQTPLYLRKLHLTKEMNLTRNTLGFENEQRMLANPNVQNILKYCQFNCDQFLKMVEIELVHRPERTGAKSQALHSLKMLKPLHLPKLLRREKTAISAHEKEDSIIFLSKSDLANLEHKEQPFDKNTNRITDKMKVFQSTKKKWFRRQEKNSSNILTCLDLDLQAKRMSMERYSDMSKLLQERFGAKSSNICPNTLQTQDYSGEGSDQDTESCERNAFSVNICNSKRNSNSNSNNTLQKALSLQNIELLTGVRKPDLLTFHAEGVMATEVTDRNENSSDTENIENRDPQSQKQQQQMFITEKLYNEFHVKTRQYSKSSSSLHQLLNFSLPQKLQINDSNRKISMAQLKDRCCGPNRKSNDKRFDCNIGEKTTHSHCPTVGKNEALIQQTRSFIAPLSPASLVDDLPYSSVRDSLIMSSEGSCSPLDISGREVTRDIREALYFLDYAKDNIYAEICHETTTAYSALSNCNNNDETSGVTDDASSVHSNRIVDDYGDYASLTYPTSLKQNSFQDSGINRVQIRCSIDDELLDQSYQPQLKSKTIKNGKFINPQEQLQLQQQQQHITTVSVMGDVVEHSNDTQNGNISDSVGLDNIYNTLK